MPLSQNVVNESIKTRLKALKVFQAENKNSNAQLLVHEIYTSIQGEGTRAGQLCTFLRLSVCHLRCQYCDTESAFHTGDTMELKKVLEQLQNENTTMIQITGGEPLLQTPIYELISKLCDLNYEVVLETSGAISTQKVDQRAVIILDVKTPASLEEQSNKYDNFQYLKQKDEVKFVICDRDDYEWSKKLVIDHQLLQKTTILFGVSYGQLPERTLAEWMIEDRLPYRFQIQLHKTLWGNKSGV